MMVVRDYTMRLKLSGNRFYNAAFFTLASLIILSIFSIINLSAQTIDLTQQVSCPAGDNDFDGTGNSADICQGGSDLNDADADKVPDDCDLCPNIADYEANVQKNSIPPDATKNFYTFLKVPEGLSGSACSGPKTLPVILVEVDGYTKTFAVPKSSAATVSPTPTPATAPQISVGCSDTDDPDRTKPHPINGGFGYDINTAGTADSTADTLAAKADYCENSNTLIEYFCKTDGNFGQSLTTCPNGCSDGKCNP